MERVLGAPMNEPKVIIVPRRRGRESARPALDDEVVGTSHTLTTVAKRTQTC